jgi:orotate phosphoribosyltransferase
LEPKLMTWKARQADLKALAEGLVKSGALQFGTFTLPDGRDSSYFVELRDLPSNPGTFKLAVDLMAGIARSKSQKSKALCGAPMMGSLLASPLSLQLGKPMVYVREGGKPSERALRGELMPDWPVLLVDDLATTGKTLLKCADAVEHEGASPTDAIVLIDRLEGARERLSKRGISLHSVTDILELADVLASIGLVTDEHMKAITKSVGRR